MPKSPRGQRHGRQPARLAAVLLSLLTTFTLLACGSADERPASRATPQTTVTSTDSGSSAKALGRSEPTWIKVPSIEARSSLVPLGLNDDRTVEIPPVTEPMQAGWYQHSPTPGELGPAVILGHVDGSGQKGIFWRLREVKQGDEVQIGRQDGSVATFTVDRVEQIPKKSFPTDQVYGDTRDAQVRLITCGGEFDRAARSYLDNVIVYGSLNQ